MCFAACSHVTDPPRKRMSSSRKAKASHLQQSSDKHDSSEQQNNNASASPGRQDTTEPHDAKFSVTASDAVSHSAQQQEKEDESKGDEGEESDDDDEIRLSPEQNRAPPPGVREWKGLESMPSATQAAVTEAFGHARAEGKDHLKVLLLGKAGVGKSSTINTLLNERVAPVSTFQPEGSKATPYSRWAAGVTLTLVDTPTIVDGDAPSESTLAELTSTLAGKEIDALLYVDRLDSWRIGKRDRAALRSITEHLGKEVWHNTIVTLTHGQLAAPPELGFKTYEHNRAAAMKSTIRAESGNEDAELPTTTVENSGRCRIKEQTGEKGLPDERPFVAELLRSITRVSTGRDAIAIPEEAEQAAEGPHSHHKKFKRWMPLLVAVQALVVRPLFRMLVKADKQQARSR